MIHSTPGFVLAGQASSGMEAVEAARDFDPDLVLLDIRMPGMDGIETARRLTASDPSVVVILVSGYDLDDVRDLAHGSGAAAVIQKERLRPSVLQRLWACHGAPRTAVQREG
jgi:CheY-like chemotaxis protein